MSGERVAATAAGVLAVLFAGSSANADPVPPRPPGSPQYIDHVEWVDNGDRATLRVFPTAWGGPHPGCSPMAPKAMTPGLSSCRTHRMPTP